MRKGIWQEFDGYNEIADEIELSRKTGRRRSFDRLLADSYIGRLHPGKLGLKVVDIFEETATTKTLRLSSEDQPLPPFIAGQYIALFLEINGVRTSRPYSISSQPKQTGYYDLTVRRVENGRVSNHLLDGVHVGDTLEASGPQGNFYHNPCTTPNTWSVLPAEAE